jgi:hypothetical protein
VLLECRSCDATVDAVEVGAFERMDEDAFDLPARYTFVQCPRCGRPMVGYQWKAASGWTMPERLWPLEGRRANPEWPTAIGLAYEEALACFKAKAFTASAIMCRKSLEVVCAHHGIKTGDLATKLKKLRESNVIESRLFDWAETLRVAGNEAAHEVGVKVSGEDARDLLDFTEALLEYVITYRDRFDEFTKRRQARAGAK